MQNKLTRDELVELARKVINVDGTESEIDHMLNIIQANVPHPAVSDLIFWPVDNGVVTPEGVIDEALSYGQEEMGSDNKSEIASLPPDNEVENNDCPSNYVDKQFGNTKTTASSVEYNVCIIVAATSGHAYTVDQWWTAFEKEGLFWGDGDLFYWKRECIAFSAEPFSVPGYFHPKDRQTNTILFPDVCFSFSLSDVHDPIASLKKMAQVAERIADSLDARILNTDGEEFDLDKAIIIVSEEYAR